jgi:cardiolipin synthase A/B
VKHAWARGNAVTLLENGEEFFPRAFGAIARARFEVLIETFILFEDKVGLELKSALIAAARRGVRVTLTVDGWGSPPGKLSEAYIEELTEAGVQFLIYGAPGRILGVRVEALRRIDFVRRIRPFRRMHRKILVVDGTVAFIGGINYSADHLADYGPESKQDYSVELRGPIVDDIQRFAERATAPAGLRASWRRWRSPPPVRAPSPAAGNADALLVVRDNRRHTTDIERHYRLAIRSARREVTIANAYFFPGYRLLRDLRRAARRGVRVRLILQGQADMAIVPFAARLLYNYLVRDGVQIYEYCRRPMHAKVALVDDHWATVGSSNLDPLSLSLNLEANVMLRDREFNRRLRERLDALVQDHCIAVDESMLPADNWWRAGVGIVAFHVLRHFPDWVQRLPTDRPNLTVLRARERERVSQRGAHD